MCLPPLSLSLYPPLLNLSNTHLLPLYLFYILILILSLPLPPHSLRISFSPPPNNTPTHALSTGNKYGEPVVCGFARSFGQRLPNKERVEWIKPIMFTAGLGWLDSRHTSKGMFSAVENSMV
jgi:hypothetical protein